MELTRQEKFILVRMIKHMKNEQIEEFGETEFASVCQVHPEWLNTTFDELIMLVEKVIIPINKPLNYLHKTRGKAIVLCEPFSQRMVEQFEQEEQERVNQEIRQTQSDKLTQSVLDTNTNQNIAIWITIFVAGLTGAVSFLQYSLAKEEKNQREAIKPSIEKTSTQIQALNSSLDSMRVDFHKYILLQLKKDSAMRAKKPAQNQNSK